jgi:hypothetical protein
MLHLLSAYSCVHQWLDANRQSPIFTGRLPTVLALHPLFYQRIIRRGRLGACRTTSAPTRSRAGIIAPRITQKSKL